MTFDRGVAALDAAFRATIYRVELPEGRFDLRIGEYDSAFDEWLRARSVSSWGILTACNPGAVRLSDDENRLRQVRLHERLMGMGRRCLPAVSLDIKDVWPPEPGCFILQIDQKSLRALAGEFSQLAFVWGEPGLPPRLLWV